MNTEDTVTEGQIKEDQIKEDQIKEAKAKEAKAKEEHELIKKCSDEKEMTIDGVVYKLEKLNYKKRLKFFAYFSGIVGDLGSGNYSFMGTDEWNKIEHQLNTVFSVEGFTLSKKPDYWDDHLGAYLRFCTVGLNVIIYPFLPENHTA